METKDINKTKKVAVIGGGASGLFAAAFCAKRGIETHIFEKNPLLGKKLYITGKGRCNITNAGDLDSFIENIPGNPYFMYSAFANLDSVATIELFKSLGLETKIERGNRVFPKSDRAKDVVEALERFVYKNKVNVHLSSPVEEILLEDKAVCGIKLKNGKTFDFDGIILATGGLSYPKTGSDGDGYRIARALGHSVTKLNPSLVPLAAKEEFCAELMGLSLKNISITVKNFKDKIIYKDFGELLFTHFGVSGPVILSASRHLIPFNEAGYRLYIDLKPALDEQTLDSRLLRDFEKNKNRDFKNSLDELLPKRLIPVIIEQSEIDNDKKVNSITKEERKRLLEKLKGLCINITRLGSFEEAVITAGGISVKEIDPGSMESKLIKNLHFAGELIDVDGYTGGFNLQIAFSTGALAGENILKDESF